jgi:hypothetical protein
MKQQTKGAEVRSTPVQQMPRVGALASWASLGSFFYYLSRGDLLMHGDATAHINIARRVIDSLYPGPLQLGTVWLPLPHLLMLPFVWIDKLWQSGIAGAIPSMVAYVFGVVGVFRLVCGILEVNEGAPSGIAVGGTPPSTATAGGLFAAFVYGANPNLLYMQTTALTETLFLAFFIWAMVFFSDFLHSLGNEDVGAELERRSLRKCAWCLAAAELTRYDGWFLAGAIGFFVLVVALARGRNRIRRRKVALFLVAIGIAPLLWLAYNFAVYSNALEFANGPYSARAIEARVGAPNPSAGNLWSAASYFLKSAQINLAVGNWGRFWLLVALAATAILAWKLTRQSAVMVLLWLPVVFYALSVAYGSVPLHVPMWWPFAIFNQRFGLELLPLFAVSAGVVLAGLLTSFLSAHLWKVVSVAAALVVASYTSVWIAKPVCWQEARNNWQMRRGLDTAVGLALREFPPQSVFLMDIDEHVGILERDAIPLRRVVNNEDHRQWVRPKDPQGAWEQALADPSQHVNYVIAFEGDLVDKGVNRQGITLLQVIHSTGQPAARIYQTSRGTNQSR